jgi:hypothetical protein
VRVYKQNNYYIETCFAGLLKIDISEIIRFHRKRFVCYVYTIVLIVRVF